MEHISNQLAVSNQGLTTYSKEPDRTLMPDERKIMEVKYAAPAFGMIPETDLRLVAQTLLLKIHVITGWVIPGKELMDILIEQFEKKMVEAYPTVNPHEMEYAFRNNDGVKDWGKNMNLNLIDEVMTPYMERRRFLSRMEESKSYSLDALPPIQTTDQEFIESVRTIYNQHKDFKRIPVLVYKSLNLNLSNEQKEEIRETVKGLISEPTNDHYKQFACKLYFDELG